MLLYIEHESGASIASGGWLDMWTSRPHPKWNELRVCIVTRSPGGSKYCSSSIWTQVILGIPADMWKSVTLYCEKITAGMTIGSSIVPFALVQLLSVPFGPQIALFGKTSNTRDLSNGQGKRIL